MGDTHGDVFGKYVPGFDFLQNLAKGATQSIPQIPNLANWVSPSLNVQELEKRIEELRAVHFWLDQNSRALGATIQALEVQKMTLATLKGMNFPIGDLANAFKDKAAETLASGVQMAAERASSAARTVSDAAAAVGGGASSAGTKRRPVTSAKSESGLIDPLHLWSALTQQFQQIAAGALQDATRDTARDATRNLATGVARQMVKAGKKTAGGGKKERKSTGRASSGSRSSG